MNTEIHVNHIEAVHEQLKYHCPLCKYKEHNRSRFKKHIALKHNNEISVKNPRATTAFCAVCELNAKNNDGCLVDINSKSVCGKK